MKIHITNIYNQLGAAGLSQQKNMKIAREMGFHELGIYRYPIEVDNDAELGRRIDGIISAVQEGDVVFFQSPSWIGLRYDLLFLRKLRGYKNIKIGILINDVIPLLFKSGEDNLRATIEIYNYADLIIAPSKSMLNFLERYGLTVNKRIVQEMWDYPVSFELSRPLCKKRIFFTGAPSRFPFVEQWNYMTPMVLYTGQDFLKKDLNIELRGYQKETKLLSELSEGGYGLVWHSCEIADEYYFLLQPYKLSTYLAAGIPVIMQKGLAPEKTIVENGLCFVVESLEEADSIVQATSEEEYNKMVNRIAEFNFLIKDGWFTKKMLTDAVMHFLNNNYQP